MDPVVTTPAPQPAAAPPATAPQTAPQQNGQQNGQQSSASAPATFNAPELAPPPAPFAQPSAVEQAAAAARAQLATQMATQLAAQAAAPAPPLTDPAAPAPASSGEQPRNADGTFAPREPVAEAAPGAPDPNADPNASAPDGTDAASDAAAQELVVPLPPRRPGEAPLEIAAPDKETAEALRRMANGYQRAEQLRAERAQLDEARADVQTRMEAFESDPVAVLESLDLETRTSIVQYLLTRPEIWAEIAPLVQEFADPREFARAQAQAEADRFRTKEHLQQQATFRTQVRSNAQQIRAAVQALIPESVDDTQAVTMYTELLKTVGDHATRNNLPLVDVEDLPVILARRCRALGIDPIEAADRLAQALSNGKSHSTTTSTTSRPRVPTPAAGGVTPPQRPSVTRVLPPAAQKTGQQFVQSEAARRAVAATPPAGAGSPGSGIAAPPPNQSIAERIEWARQNPALATAPPR